jgi:hypothetical protein
MDKIKNLLPAKDLSSMDLGGRQFVTAPMADLPILFPHTALAPRPNSIQTVYTLRSTFPSNP